MLSLGAVASPTSAAATTPFNDIAAMRSAPAPAAADAPFTPETPARYGPQPSVSYALARWETPNDTLGDVCADGLRSQDKINLSGCAKVLNRSELVKIGDKYYALDITGLIHDGNPVEEFWTRKKTAESGELRAQLRLVSAAVPEPANWGMMIVGFGVAGSVVRLGRRRRILQV
ncbi:PEPxxWA-CTERM sorting domain-containing protein [Phenylobacterium sp.]|uniref:PEPxxWA-CTERM sorting domain-containing protein n=1 Tax=Phenylobacterium sp. TaxID=1871053 RepID=UPI00289CB7AE|nr:PEPxxWA-CTERM sorting domain-containing protein [Phenylobacterium sp.]